MKTKMINKFKMLIDLGSFMEKNQKIWAPVKEIEKAYAKYDDHIDQMQELKAEIEIDLQAHLDKKNKSRQALIAETMPVINILKAYSIECKNKKLLKKCDIDKKKIEKLKDSKLAECCKTAWKESRKLYNNSTMSNRKTKFNEQDSANIRNYGLSIKMIDNIDEVNNTFILAKQEYEDAKNLKTKLTRKFESLIQKNERIIQNKFNLLFSIFEQDEPEFYKQYLNILKVEKPKKTKKIKAEKELKQEISIEKETPQLENTNTVQKTTTAKRAPVKRTGRAVQRPKTTAASKTRTSKTNTTTEKPENKETP